MVGYSVLPVSLSIKCSVSSNSVWGCSLPERTETNDTLCESAAPTEFWVYHPRKKMGGNMRNIFSHTASLPWMPSALVEYRPCGHWCNERTVRTHRTAQGVPYRTEQAQHLYTAFISSLLAAVLHCHPVLSWACSSVTSVSPVLDYKGTSPHSEVLISSLSGHVTSLK